MNKASLASQEVIGRVDPKTSLTRMAFHLQIGYLRYGSLGKLRYALR